MMLDYIQNNNKTMSQDYLSVDPPIGGQVWVCLSFISPEQNSNCTVRGLKIRGVFGTREEADKHAKKLSEIDSYFDVFVGEVGKWLPWDPDPNSQNADVVYQNEQLNELVKGHQDNMEKGKVQYEKRKDEMLKKGAEEERDKIKKNSDARTQETRKRLQKKLAQKKMDKNIDKNMDKKMDDGIETTIESPVEPSDASFANKMERIKELHERIKANPTKDSNEDVAGPPE